MKKNFTRLEVGATYADRRDRRRIVKALPKTHPLYKAGYRFMDESGSTYLKNGAFLHFDAISTFDLIRKISPAPRIEKRVPRVMWMGMDYDYIKCHLDRKTVEKCGFSTDQIHKFINALDRKGLEKALGRLK